MKRVIFAYFSSQRERLVKIKQLRPLDSTGSWAGNSGQHMFYFNKRSKGVGNVGELTNESS